MEAVQPRLVTCDGCHSRSRCTCLVGSMQMWGKARSSEAGSVRRGQLVRRPGSTQRTEHSASQIRRLPSLRSLCNSYEPTPSRALPLTLHTPNSTFDQRPTTTTKMVRAPSATRSPPYHAAIMENPPVVGASLLLTLSRERTRALTRARPLRLAPCQASSAALACTSSTTCTLSAPSTPLRCVKRPPPANLAQERGEVAGTDPVPALLLLLLPPPFPHNPKLAALGTSVVSHLDRLARHPQGPHQARVPCPPWPAPQHPALGRPRSRKHRRPQAPRREGHRRLLGRRFPPRGDPPGRHHHPGPDHRPDKGARPLALSPSPRDALS